MRNFCFLVLIILTTPAFGLDVVNYASYGRSSLFYDDYYVQLLKLILDNSTDEFGPYQLNAIEMGITQEHMVSMIKHRKAVNIFWTMTSREREEQLQPIRIPLVKGMGGCRIFLINNTEQKKFDQVKSVEELKQLLSGQGKDWPDTQILKANGFNVLSVKEHVSLFSMLRKKRFEYFPRAIHEAFNEVKTFSGLAIEQNFVLYYPSPFFYFVSKENQRLANRITSGLNKIINEGVYEEFFNENPFSKDMISKANIKNRVLYKLDNPLLTEATQQALKKYEYQGICTQ